MSAIENPLLGTWKLKSYVVTASNGETTLPYGAQPMGYLSYAADGRMQVVGTSSERAAPRDRALTDRERGVLFETMFAYGGTYSLEAGKVIHHVDISWNESWNGTDQVRFYRVSGTTLTITSRLADPASGQEADYVVTWEKVTGPSTRA